jgi:hypothetical protein
VGDVTWAGVFQWFILFFLSSAAVLLGERWEVRVGLEYDSWLFPLFTGVPHALCEFACCWQVCVHGFSLSCTFMMIESRDFGQRISLMIAAL